MVVVSGILGVAMAFSVFVHSGVDACPNPLGHPRLFLTLSQGCVGSLWIGDGVPASETLPGFLGIHLVSPSLRITPELHRGFSARSVIVTIPLLWLLMGSIALAFLTLRRLHTLERRGPGKCPKCTYDLRGIAGTVCPECGTPKSVEAKGVSA